MFYNHDILTDRKHGVATIWLVATLGSKSTLRKVTRKAIMDVDVPNACETITDPAAPLALRLQGSLLFGVSRVFSQQCAYVLTDMQHLRDKMRGITMLLKDLEVDPDVATTRPEQLNLQVDPGFNIELDLGFDLSSFDLQDSSTDEPSSLLSPRSSASSHTSLQDDELGLVEQPPLHHSSSHRGLEGLDFDDGGFADDNNIQRQTVQLQDLLLVQSNAITEDDSIQIKENGQLVVRDNTIFQDHAQAGPEEAVSPVAQVEDFQFDLDMGADPVGDQINIPPQPEDDQDISVGAEKQPFTTGPPLQHSSLTTQQPNADVFNSVEEADNDQADAETIVVARAAPQRNKTNRTIPIDNPAELQNSTLGEWDNRYTEIMEDAHKEHASKTSVAQAKRNAAYWILDQGIGGVSADFREDGHEHPLAIFSGQALLEMFDGTEEQSGSRKRSASAGSEAEERRVRPRSEDEQPRVSNEQDDFEPRFDDDGSPAPNNNDGDDGGPEPEIGRKPEAPLSNGPETWPWNELALSRQGSRHGSIRPPMSATGVSSGAGGPGAFEIPFSSVGSKRISRLISESPLEQRRRLLRQSSLAGSAVRPGIAGNEIVGEDDFAMGFDLDDSVEIDRQLAGDLQDAEYELYGPAAPALASTQQVADSKWLASTLEKEAYNFLAFIETTIEGKKADTEDNIVTFEELLPPETNSHVVAAQGLLHVLSLATKGLIDVVQETSFGNIEMNIAEHEASSEVEAV